MLALYEVDKRTFSNQVHGIIREDGNGKPNLELPEKEMEEMMNICKVIEWIIHHEFSKGNHETTFDDWSKSLFGLFPLKGKATRYYQRSHKSSTGTLTGPSGLAHVIWRRIHGIAEIARFAEPTRQLASSATEVALNDINNLLHLAAWEALRAYRLKSFLELSIDGILKKIPGIGSADTELRKNLGLVVIAHRLGPYKCSTKRKKSDKTCWTAKTDEVLDSFILQHENSSGDPVVNSPCLSKEIGTLKAVYNANYLELTAYVIVIDKLDKIESSHVVIGSHSYSIPGQNSLLLSVDIFFKCMYALKKSFPKASTLIWSFLASEVYKIKKDTAIF
ncbi:hypothetical protein QAD02_013870 [Eretmocerus hayati]|uniref:Uncharacterized protein n=1 Tax=Eretmocerus hayati TaxID=131215 RepID=A0ACC2P3N5_9HYME|nr:hypothetical protein QAD02_013870 [Eretmocerus hayati]